MRFVYGLLVFVSIYVYQLACIRLTPCGPNSRDRIKEGNGDKWFKWGQLYSFCMQTYNNVTHNNVTAFDHGCTTLQCKDCISVCALSKVNITLHKCEQGCKSEICKIGCRFYDNIFNISGDFRTNETSLPYLNKTVVREQPNRNNVEFKWSPVESHDDAKLSSVYLITIQGRIEQTDDKEDEFILGLMSNPEYIATMDDMCNHIYSSYKYNHPELAFALTVYPVNFHGPTNRITSIRRNLFFTSKFTYPTRISPIQNLTLASDPPLFQKGDDYNNIIWNMKWSIPMDNRSVGIRYKGKKITCPRSDITRQMLYLNRDNLRYQDAKGAGYANIALHNDKDDNLNTCKIFIEFTIKYGKCLLSEPVMKIIDYPGCEQVTNYTDKCHREPAKIDTMLDKVNITLVDVTCNSTLIYNGNCPGDNHAKCKYCKKPKYKVAVSWLPPNESYPVHNYTIRWGKCIMDLLLSGGINVFIVPPDTTSYETEIHSEDANPFLLGIQVIAETDISKPSDLRTSGTKKLKWPLKIYPKNVSEISTVVTIIAVLLAFVAICAILKVYRDRIRRRRTNNSNISDEIYMTSEKAVIADEWEIYPANITVNEKIGEGTFGTVFSATIDNNTLAKTKFARHCGGVALMNDKTNILAVKFLKEGAQDEEHCDFQDEILLMKGIGYHKNIVNMIGCSTIKEPLCLVVEYMQQGDLLHYLRKQRSKTLNSQSNDNDNNTSNADDMMSFSWQIACGMEYLATKNVVHRDLAARNILVGANKIVKISDFGLSRQVSQEPIYVSHNKTRKLPVKWMSVEAIYHKEFTVASDVWAYGVVLFEIVTVGGAPYPFIGNRELCKMLKSGYRMERPDNCTEEIYDIMLHCWNEIPTQRPTFTELREHLEKIVEQGDRYFSFEIDESKAYYNVASFKSIPSDDEEDTLFTEEYDEKPIQVKTVDSIKFVMIDTQRDGSDETNETDRYISPQSLKVITDLEKTSVSFDNPNFHFHE